MAGTMEGKIVIGADAGPGRVITTMAVAEGDPQLRGEE